METLMTKSKGNAKTKKQWQKWKMSSAGASVDSTWLRKKTVNLKIGQISSKSPQIEKQTYNIYTIGIWKGKKEIGAKEILEVQWPRIFLK